jgi:multisubunit Na+/H+ antiporter MnhC subunit
LRAEVAPVTDVHSHDKRARATLAAALVLAALVLAALVLAAAAALAAAAYHRGGGGRVTRQRDEVFLSGTE